MRSDRIFRFEGMDDMVARLTDGGGERDVTRILVPNEVSHCLVYRECFKCGWIYRNEKVWPGTCGLERRRGLE